MFLPKEMLPEIDLAALQSNAPLVRALFRSLDSAVVAAVLARCAETKLLDLIEWKSYLPPKPKKQKWRGSYRPADTPKAWNYDLVMTDLVRNGADASLSCKIKYTCTKSTDASLVGKSAVEALSARLVDGVFRCTGQGITGTTRLLSPTTEGAVLLQEDGENWKLLCPVDDVETVLVLPSEAAEPEAEAPPVPSVVGFKDTEGDASELKLDPSTNQLSWWCHGRCYLENITVLTFAAGAIKAPQNPALIARLVDPPEGVERERMLANIYRMATNGGRACDISGFPEDAVGRLRRLGSSTGVGIVDDDDDDDELESPFVNLGADGVVGLLALCLEDVSAVHLPAGLVPDVSLEWLRAKFPTQQQSLQAVYHGPSPAEVAATVSKATATNWLDLSSPCYASLYESELAQLLAAAVSADMLDTPSVSMWIS
eukprot:SAG11_NODE_1446_length_4891_cov_1.703673_2_plen_428_part_00